MRIRPLTLSVLAITCLFVGCLAGGIGNAFAEGELVSGTYNRTRPACSELSGQRGRLWAEQSASGTVDFLYQCQRDALGSYSWVSVLVGSSIDTLDVNTLTFGTADGDTLTVDDITATTADFTLLTFDTANGVQLNLSGGGTGIGAGAGFNQSGTTIWNSLNETDANADEKRWTWRASGGVLSLLGVTDASDGSATLLSFIRDGTSLAEGSLIGALLNAPLGVESLELNGESGGKPTCEQAIRGRIYYTAGGAGVADIVEVCSKSAADAYAWRDIALVTP